MSKGKKEVKKEAEVVPEVVIPRIEVGRFTFSDGSIYDGEFENRENGTIKVRHGKGTFSNGPESYTGSWENDFMQGEGRYIFSSGAVYNGAFQNGMFQGFGKYQYLDGSFYEGSWNGSKMHGKGKFVGADGIVRWEGTFFNGLFDSGKSYVSVIPPQGV